MAPKKRNKENRPLPERWRYKHGAYYYRVPLGLEASWDGKKEFRLGKTLSESYKEWSNRISLNDTHDISLISQLMDRYSLEVIPNKEKSTQESNLLSLKKLRPVFGQMKIKSYKDDCSIKPKHAYK